MVNPPVNNGQENEEFLAMLQQHGLLGMGPQAISENSYSVVRTPYGMSRIGPSQRFQFDGDGLRAAQVSEMYCYPDGALEGFPTAFICTGCGVILPIGLASRCFECDVLLCGRCECVKSFDGLLLSYCSRCKKRVKRMLFWRTVRRVLCFPFVLPFILVARLFRRER